MMNYEQFSKLFPFGSHLCREPMPPMSEMKKDLEILKKAGFNLVKLQEHWSYDEPEEGKYDFSKYEELIDYAAKLDLAVYLGLTCEQAPAWLYQKYPDCRMIRSDGVPVAYEPQMTLPADGKPGPCFDHPGVQKSQRRFLKKLIQTLGVFENIVVWNTWQEITTNEWSAGMAGGSPVCYCPYTLEFFREWLKTQYKDLDGLNNAWKTRFCDWKYVFPERIKKYLLPQTLDWNYFMENIVTAKVLQDRCQIIKESDPRKRPVFAHSAVPQIASGIDWTYAKTQDFLSSSCYPASPAWSGIPVLHWDDSYPRKNSSREKNSALLAEIADSIILRFDYIRSCNNFSKPVWAAEFQGGPISNGFNKGRTPAKEDIRRWLFTGLGAGLTGVVFWVTRAEIAGAEADGYSLLNSEDDTSERLEEAARICKVLNEHADIFGKTSFPRNAIAILVNDRNFQLCRQLPTAMEHLKYSTRGWHRLLWESGINVDFLEISHATTDEMSQYKCLILPVPLSISDENAEKLMAYVKSGGNLVSEACCGKFNDNSYCNRGELSPLMRKMFAVKHKDTVMVREPGNEMRWLPDEAAWGMYREATKLRGVGLLKGHRLQTNVYLETFECSGSDPVLKYGDEIAGVVNEYGQGTAWLLGTFAGHNGNAYRDESTWATVLSILEQCKVLPEKCGKLLLSKRVIPDKEAWIFFNPTSEDVVEKINVKGWKKVSCPLNGELKREKDLVKLSVRSLDASILIIER